MSTHYEKPLSENSPDRCVLKSRLRKVGRRNGYRNLTMSDRIKVVCRYSFGIYSCAGQKNAEFNGVGWELYFGPQL